VETEKLHKTFLQLRKRSMIPASIESIEEFGRHQFNGQEKAQRFLIQWE
jgi:hypothetical protein